MIQSANNNNINYTQGKDLFKNKYYIEQKNKDLKKEINSIVSQVAGKVKDVKIKYNKNLITKATVTVIVSEEEAKSIKISSDKVKLNIIIDKTKNSNKEKKKDEKEKVAEPENINSTYNASLNKDDKKKSTVYSFNRGPDGKMYGIATIKKEENHYKKMKSSFKPINIYKNANKNIDTYKRYNFKDIHVRDKKDSSKFTLFI